MVPLLHCCFCLSCSEQEEFPGFAPRNLGSDLHLLLINWVTMSEGTASPTPRPLSCQMCLQTKKLKKKKKKPTHPPKPCQQRCYYHIILPTRKSERTGHLVKVSEQ